MLSQTNHGMKNAIKIVIKAFVGGGVVWYVLSSRMVDFTSLGEIIFKPSNVTIGLGFLSITVLCCATRWYLLVKAQGLSLSFGKLFQLTMIGNFFNTFMPGSVGGDLVKAWYVIGHEPQRKTKAVFTVLLDRIIGLSVIIFYAAGTLAIYHRWVDGRKELQLLGYIIWTFTVCSFAALILFFSPWFSSRGRFFDFLRRFKSVAKIIDATLLYQKQLPTIAFAVALSATSILATNIFCSIEGSAIGITMSVSKYFFIVPIALTVSAIPLLPGGIGVGQVAFFTLFQWVGIPNPEKGGALATLFQMYNIMFSLIGGIIYLRFKRAPHSFVQT
ncbi:MAG: flippase-like domain-containing protein [Deltaproteobacteria bacterium]|nr:flippase-like domain-containing protein [Deltaproteobacteria bacterium]